MGGWRGAATIAEAIAGCGVMLRPKLPAWCAFRQVSERFGDHSRRSGSGLELRFHWELVDWDGTRNYRQTKMTRRDTVLGGFIGLVLKPKEPGETQEEINSIVLSYVDVNKIRVSFKCLNPPFTIWSPSCSMFWSSLSIKCRLRSKKREWRLWRGRSYDNDKPKSISVSPEAGFDIEIGVDEDTWPAVGRITSEDGPIGHHCDCWLEWEPVLLSNAKMLAIRPGKLVSNAIPIRLVLKGIY
jgi:hypothetical protein